MHVELKTSDAFEQKMAFKKKKSLFFRPHPGEIRQIYIEKSSEALGITIKENQTKKGVFVSSVSENSLANQVGLQVKQTNLHLLIKTNGKTPVFLAYS